jgi:hypothetical protein
MRNTRRTARQYDESASKQLHRENQHQVLRTPTIPASQTLTVTVSGRAQARKRYERLAPWLELANLAAPMLGDDGPEPGTLDDLMLPVLRYVGRAQDSDFFPAEQLRRYARQWPDRAGKQLQSLAIDVARAFILCLDEDLEAAFAVEEGPRLAIEVFKSKGVVDFEVFDPFRDCFLPAIKGVEVARIRRCPVCRKIFFAMRHKAGSKYGSKACSRQCNQTLRVRRHRAKQADYEYGRKLKLAGLRPEKERR